MHSRDVLYRQIRLYVREEQVEKMLKTVLVYSVLSGVGVLCGCVSV